MQNQPLSGKTGILFSQQATEIDPNTKSRPGLHDFELVTWLIMLFFWHVHSQFNKALSHRQTSVHIPKTNSITMK